MDERQTRSPFVKVSLKMLHGVLAMWVLKRYQPYIQQMNWIRVPTELSGLELYFYSSWLNQYLILLLVMVHIVE